MRLFFGILLIVSFAGTAVFGVLAMDHENGGLHAGCPAAGGKAGSCLNDAGVFSLLFHLGVFRGFSTATFDGSTALTVFLALFAALLLWSFSRFRRITLESRPVLSQDFRRFETAAKLQGIRLIHWLSRLERSPSPA